MSHLIDPCLRATKIAHGIRRGIDGISPLSGLVPELRILIQEQKNVLASLKRTAFEKEEAAKHLAIYAKTEGPDIADTLTKLSILVQKAADLERVYANSLAQSRELFKEIRVAEDENYSIRKRKLDLEQKLALDKSYSSSTISLTGKQPSVHGPELHPEMKLLRQETMSVENDLEDLKRKKIKKATCQQLDALEKLGKELIVVAHYGRRVMDELDDSPTPAGTYADDRYATYEGAAKTAYTVKAFMDTFKAWPSHEPQVQISDVDLGDFPRDNKQVMDAMLKDLASKSGSDWYALQSPSSSKAPSTHGRTNSSDSVGFASPRNSISSLVTTTTYVDGVPTIQVINEIPPTPESEEAPVNNEKEDATSLAAAQEPIPVFVGGEGDTRPTSLANSASSTTNDTTPAATSNTSATDTTTSSVDPSPFVSHSTYKPTTAYQPGYAHDAVDGQRTPPSRSRPHSGEHYPITHAPHPLMMQQTPFQPKQQYYQPLYPPGPPGGGIPSQMPMPMPMPVPMQMSMPVPNIPSSSDDREDGGNKRHSQPISVSFPLRPPIGLALDHSAGMTSPTAGMPLSSRSPSPSHQNARRNPHAVLPPTEPGFHVPVGTEISASQETPKDVYDGPPPDYAEASMQPPAEKRDEKKRR